MDEQRTPALDDKTIKGPQASILSGDRFLHEQIGRLSTGTLAPLLNTAHRRFRWAWVVLVCCAGLAWLTVASGSQSWMLFVAALIAIVLPLSVWLDRYRRTVRVRYVLRDAAEKISVALADSFDDLRKCSAIWLLDAAAYTAEAKIKKRHPTKLQMKRPPCMRGKDTFPTIDIGSAQLYFLPDALLSVTPASVTSVRYQDIAVDNIEIRFIEEGTPPADTSVVGETWKYLDKHGAPDHRQVANERLSVCLYGELHLRLPSGPGGRLQYSNARAAARFVRILEALRKADPKVLQAGSMIAYEKPSALPAVALSVVFLLGAAMPVAALSPNKIAALAWLRVAKPVTYGSVPPSVRPASVRPRPAPAEIPLPPSRPKASAAPIELLRPELPPPPAAPVAAGVREPAKPAAREPKITAKDAARNMMPDIAGGQR